MVRREPTADDLSELLAASLDAVESLRQEVLRQLARVQADRAVAQETEQRRPEAALGRAEAQAESMILKLKQLERLVLRVEATVKQGEARARRPLRLRSARRGRRCQ